MPDLEFIVKTPKLEPSQNYALLRAEGLKHIERLAHRLWTDYNIHDPGVTILELLCYAVTELGYRTGYGIQDLLTETDRGAAVIGGSFHTAVEILTCNPVSFDDLRKLLIDIRGIRNAWIEPHCSVAYCLDEIRRELVDCSASNIQARKNPSVGGLYDVYIEGEDYVQRDPRSLRVGLPDNETGSGGFVSSQGQGIRFHVAYPLILQAVSVYPEAAGEVTVRLFRKGEQSPIADATEPLARAGEKNRIQLGFRLVPGEDYRLESHAEVNLYRTSAPAFPYALKDVIYLVSGVQGTAIHQAYYFFYDWEITYAAPPPAIFSPPPVTAAVGPEKPSGAGDYVDTLDHGVEFEAMRDLVLKTVDVYAEGVGDVTIRLLDETGVELEHVKTSVDSAQQAARVDLGFELDGGRKYRLDALGTTVRLYRTTGAYYPFSKETVIKLTAGHPVPDTVYFFYQWTVSYPSQPLPATVTSEDIRLAARERLCAHRNLCEDFVNICELETEEVAVCADIEVSPSADVEEVLAEIFYRLGLHVSPRVSFYTIEELLDRGKTTEQIFEGPPLDHGFIDDDEFQKIQRRCEIRTSDVVRMLMDVKGVVAVKTISLLSFLDPDRPTQEEWVLELATDRFRAPTFARDRSKIVLYKNDLPYYGRRGRVSELLAEKKAADLESKLKGHDRDLPVPVGEFRNSSEYYPLQSELPMNYFVGQIRVPVSEGALRKAQSRQLKAYLLFFEQLLANFLAQLAHVGKLFSWEDDGDSTYFTQQVNGIAELQDLYFPELDTLDQELAAIIEDKKTATERKNRFLGHLVGRFAESFTDYSLLMYSMLQDASLRRVNDDQRAFLSDYARLSRERGTAYDYRYPEYADNLSGYQRRVYRLLGFQDVTRRNLAGHRFEIENVEVLGNGTRWRFVLEDEDGGILFESICCESRGAIEGLLDSALSIGGDANNYRPAETVYELVRRCEGAEDEPIGWSASLDADELAEVQAYFREIGGAEGFHVVEHVLLRKRTKDDPFLPVQLNDEECECVAVREPYSFRMSILLPSWPKRFQDIKFRRFVEDLLRVEAPAHIFPRICWISHMQMKEFEECYGYWSDNLAELTEGLGGCRTPEASLDSAPLSAEMPLSTAQPPEDYAQALGHLIDELHRLVTVYPLARLHDCTETETDEPQITLNNTRLGTF